MRITLSTILAGLLLSALAASASAHHSFAANFDASKPVRFNAIVTKMEWINPHAWLHADVPQPDGGVEKWMIEAGSPIMLFRQGLNKNSVMPGMEVIVDGYQARDGSRRANGRDITLPDGRKLFLSGAGDPP